MRITLQDLLGAQQIINAAKERQMSLRGRHIELIENLGATQDQYECIDLSDNSIIKIENGSFPLLKRLKTLVLSNNWICRIEEKGFDNLPALQSIVLTKNRLKSLIDLAPLGRVKSLQRLTLKDNDVCQDVYYRNYVIYMLRNTALRFLDFQKVTEKDRLTALAIFEDPNDSDLLLRIAPQRRSKEEEKEERKRKLPAEQQRIYAKLIAMAKTQNEIEELEAKWGRGEAPPLMDESDVVVNGGEAEMVD